MADNSRQTGRSTGRKTGTMRVQTAEGVKFVPISIKEYKPGGARASTLRQTHQIFGPGTQIKYKKIKGKDIIVGGKKVEPVITSKEFQAERKRTGEQKRIPTGRFITRKIQERPVPQREQKEETVSRPLTKKEIVSQLADRRSQLQRQMRSGLLRDEVKEKTQIEINKLDREIQEISGLRRKDIVVESTKAKQIFLPPNLRFKPLAEMTLKEKIQAFGKPYKLPEKEAEKIRQKVHGDVIKQGAGVRFFKNVDEVIGATAYVRGAKKIMVALAKGNLTPTKEDKKAYIIITKLNRDIERYNRLKKQNKLTDKKKEEIISSFSKNHSKITMTDYNNILRSMAKTGKVINDPDVKTYIRTTAIITAFSLAPPIIKAVGGIGLTGVSGYTTGKQALKTIKEPTADNYGKLVGYSIITTLGVIATYKGIKGIKKKGDLKQVKSKIATEKQKVSKQIKIAQKQKMTKRVEQLKEKLDILKKGQKEVDWLLKNDYLLENFNKKNFNKLFDRSVKVQQENIYLNFKNKQGRIKTIAKEIKELVKKVPKTKKGQQTKSLILKKLNVEYNKAIKDIKSFYNTNKGRLASETKALSKKQIRKIEAEGKKEVIIESMKEIKARQPTGKDNLFIQLKNKEKGIIKLKKEIDAISKGEAKTKTQQFIKNTKLRQKGQELNKAVKEIKEFFRINRFRLKEQTAGLSKKKIRGLIGEDSPGDLIGNVKRIKATTQKEYKVEFKKPSPPPPKKPPPPPKKGTKEIVTKTGKQELILLQKEKGKLVTKTVTKQKVKQIIDLDQKTTQVQKVGVKSAQGQVIVLIPQMSSTHEERADLSQRLKTVLGQKEVLNVKQATEEIQEQIKAQSQKQQQSQKQEQAQFQRLNYSFSAKQISQLKPKQLNIQKDKITYKTYNKQLLDNITVTPPEEIVTKKPGIFSFDLQKAIEKLKKKKKKKLKFTFQLTPTLAGLGEKVTPKMLRSFLTGHKFTGFEVRGSIINFKKPVKVRKYKRRNLKTKMFVKRHHRRKPRR